MQHQRDSFCAVCVDMGTTNTRVWLVSGNEVLGRASASVGARDTARDGSDNADSYGTARSYKTGSNG